MSQISPVILATSVVATGVAAFLGGFLLGAPKSHAAANRPIVDPLAWEVSAPARAQAPLRPQPLRPEPLRKVVADCSPWDVSDTAMEAVLDEMQRRGWRPPREVEAILADADLMRAWREDTVQAGASAIAIVSDAESAQLWDTVETPEPPLVVPAIAQPADTIDRN